MLAPVLRQDDPSLGMVLKKCGPREYQLEEPIPWSLKFYFADSTTTTIIKHNLKWADGKCRHPIFQFAYIMLPTLCNQACRGCFMGQDKKKLPQHLNGTYFSEAELFEILSFLKKHGAKAIVYGGGGELFTWDRAFDFIQTVADFDLKMVIFTNGTLLSGEDVSHLNE